MLRNAIALVEMEENGGSFGSFGSFDPIPVPPDNNFNSVSRKSIVFFINNVLAFLHF